MCWTKIVSTKFLFWKAKVQVQTMRQHAVAQSKTGRLGWTFECVHIPHRESQTFCPHLLRMPEKKKTKKKQTWKAIFAVHVESKKEVIRNNSMLEVKSFTNRLLLWLNTTNCWQIFSPRSPLCKPLAVDSSWYLVQLSHFQRNCTLDFWLFE